MEIEGLSDAFALMATGYWLLTTALGCGAIVAQEADNRQAKAFP
jgi:hypothetical protein